MYWSRVSRRVPPESPKTASEPVDRWAQSGLLNGSFASRPQWIGMRTADGPLVACVMWGGLVGLIVSSGGGGDLLGKPGCHDIADFTQIGPTISRRSKRRRPPEGFESTARGGDKE